MTPTEVVQAADRSDADKALDGNRRPAAFLEALQLKPGMHVGELFSIGGYMAELLARAVGPTGVVVGQNLPAMLAKFAEKPWSERLSKPVMKTVKRADTELERPFEPDASLDLVVFNATYHDAVWLKADRAKMNAGVFAALKPGGRYVVSDSSAVVGSGEAHAQTLHRIDESFVRREVEAAGFTFVSEQHFLRNPDDDRTWSASPSAAGDKRGTGDRFFFVFQKPLKG